MQSFKLPESQEKHNIIQHLKEKIKECQDGVDASETSQQMSRKEEEWWIKLSVYREILEMIQ